jgi:hypothetical protein
MRKSRVRLSVGLSTIFYDWQRSWRGVFLQGRSEVSGRKWIDAISIDQDNIADQSCNLLEKEPRGAVFGAVQSAGTSLPLYFLQVPGGTAPPIVRDKI